MSNWERLDFEPKQGEFLHHTNGRDYYVIQMFKTDYGTLDMLLQDTNSAQIVHALGVKKYSVTEDNITKVGICWDSGNYYGNDITKIDFRALRKRYEPKEVLPVQQDDKISVNDYIINHCEKSYGAVYGTPWHLASEEDKADYFTARKQEFLENTSTEEREALNVSEEVEDSIAEYEVEIKETRSAKFKVYATDKYTAKDVIDELYRYGEIEMDEDRVVENEITVSNRDYIPFLENVNQKCR